MPASQAALDFPQRVAWPCLIQNGHLHVFQLELGASDLAGSVAAALELYGCTVTRGSAGVLLVRCPEDY